MLQYVTHILLDAARMGEAMEMAQQRNSTHDSLYRGRSEESLSEVAPYIFTLIGKKEFLAWYFDKGWGDSWGVIVKSVYPMEELHKHFRKFLMVQTEDGEELYFRFYDPRVLRIFLPTCDQSQIREFFEKIDYFIVEDEDPAFATRYWQENWVLRQQQIKVEDLKGSYLDGVVIPPDVVDTKNDELELSNTNMGQLTLPNSQPSPNMHAGMRATLKDDLPSSNAPSFSTTPQLPSVPVIKKYTSIPNKSVPALPVIPDVLPHSNPVMHPASGLPNISTSIPQLNTPSITTPSSIPQPIPPSATVPSVKGRFNLFDDDFDAKSNDSNISKESKIADKKQIDDVPDKKEKDPPIETHTQQKKSKWNMFD